MTENEDETFTDFRVRKILEGSADLDAAKVIAERTGDPRLLGEEWGQVYVIHFAPPAFAIAPRGGGQRLVRAS